MNYVDIIIIVLLVLAFFVGFIGKLSHKITHLVMLVLSLALAYVLGAIFATSGLAEKIISWFKLEQYVEMMNSASPQFLVLFGGIKRFVLFFVFSLILFLIFGFFGIIINHKLFKPKKEKTEDGKKKFKNTALFGGQVISVLWMGLFLLFFLAPVALFRAPATTAISMTQAEDHAPNALDKTLAQFNESKITNLTEKALEKRLVPFMSYTGKNSEDKTVTYYFYDDTKGADKLLNILKNFKAKNINLSELSVDNKEEISKLLDALDEALTELDQMREELGSEASIDIIIGDLVKYVFSDVEDDAKPVLLKSIMNGGSEYLEGFDYYNDPYKDKIPAVLLQLYLNKAKESSDNNYSDLLKYVYVADMTFAELKTNILTLPDLINLFTSKDVKTEDEVYNVLTASTLCRQVIKGIMERYYGEGTFNDTSFDYHKEAKAISDVLNYANSEDNSLLDAPSFVDGLCESDILPALIDYYNSANPDSKIEIKVDLVKYSAINSALLAARTAEKLTQKQYETYRDIIKTE